VAPTDPGRAARLTADAERIALSITDQEEKASVLVTIVSALAAADPDHAERIATSISDDISRAYALARIVGGSR
jgi:hypothetical protein